MTPATVSFDYSALSAPVAKKAQAAAGRIRERHNSVVKSFIETGQDLLDIKAELDHGQFGAWLASEFAWTPRTAQNYMAAASEFGGKYETVSYLPPSTIYALASPATPAALKEKIRKRLDAGEEVPAAEIRGEISAARLEAAFVAREAKRAAKRRALPDRRRREEPRRAYEEERAASRAATDKVIGIIVEQLAGQLPELLVLLKKSDLLELGGLLFAAAEAA